jgi:hypothetical protein
MQPSLSNQKVDRECIIAETEKWLDLFAECGSDGCWVVFLSPENRLWIFACQVDPDRRSDETQGVEVKVAIEIETHHHLRVMMGA